MFPFPFNGLTNDPNSQNPIPSNPNVPNPNTPLNPNPNFHAQNPNAHLYANPNIHVPNPNTHWNASPHLHAHNPVTHLNTNPNFNVPNPNTHWNASPNFHAQNPNTHMNANPNFHAVNPNPYFQHPTRNHRQQQLGGLLPQQLMATQFFQNNAQLQGQMWNQLIQLQTQGLLMGRNPALGCQNPLLQGNSMLGLLESNPHTVGTMPGMHYWAQQPQVYRAEVNNTCSRFTPQNYANRNPKGNFSGFGNRQSSSIERFQGNQPHNKKNPDEDMRPFNRNNIRGQHNQRGGQPQSKSSGEEDPTTGPRCTINYTEDEIRLWREARKMNYPTGAKVNKEVLAKQAELGTTVAEIPSSCLHQSEERVHEVENNVEDQGDKNVHKRKVADISGPSPSNEKRSTSKRWQPWNKAVVKREPSLLNKLLTADIKRDNSWLLQVFRFMVLNDFFKHWPGMPLTFPVITVISRERNPTTRLESLAGEISSQKEIDPAGRLLFGSGTEQEANQHVENEGGKAEHVEIEDGQADQRGDEL